MWACDSGCKNSSDLINLKKNMRRKEALSQGLRGPAPAGGAGQTAFVCSEPGSFSGPLPQ